MFGWLKKKDGCPCCGHSVDCTLHICDKSKCHINVKLQAEVEKYKRAAKFIAAFHTDSFKTLSDVVDASEKDSK